MITRPKSARRTRGRHTYSKDGLANNENFICGGLNKTNESIFTNNVGDIKGSDTDHDESIKHDMSTMKIICDSSSNNNCLQNSSSTHDISDKNFQRRSKSSQEYTGNNAKVFRCYTCARCYYTNFIIL